MSAHTKASLWGIAFAVLVVALWAAAHWDPTAFDLMEDGDAAYPGGQP